MDTDILRSRSGQNGALNTKLDIWILAVVHIEMIILFKALEDSRAKPRTTFSKTTQSATLVALPEIINAPEQIGEKRDNRALQRTRKMLAKDGRETTDCINPT
jgi:hypothetical protein